MSLRLIIGQDRAVRILLATLGRDRVPAALLLSGESGIGKKLAAINYAKAINCEQPVEYDSCDGCASCRKIDSGLHPDMLLLSPESEEIRIEAIRKVIEFLSLRPFEAKRKVVIIDDAETMNTSAANAFLKTLEEPPEESTILLVSSNPDRLPGTVRSRCVPVRFFPLPADRCEEVLSRAMSGKDGRILRLAMGRPGLALSTDLLGQWEWFMKLLNHMLDGESRDAWADKSEMREWLEMSSILMRDMVVFAITGRRSDLLYGADYRADGVLDLLEAHAALNTVKGLIELNLNKLITWNYVATVMRRSIAGSVHKP